MKINRFEISNYRSCINTKLDLDENLTALIGINGVGKSNILYGFQLFNKIKNNRQFLFGTPQDGLSKTKINIEIEFNSRKIYVRSDFFYETDERNIDDVIFTEIKYRFEGDNPRKWNKINPEIFDIVEYYKNRNSNHRIQIPKQFQTGAFEFETQLIQSLSNINYYSATQFSDPSKCPVSIESDDYRLSNRSKTQNIHQKFIHDLYRIKNSSKNTYDLFLNTVGKKGLNLIDEIHFNVHEIPSSSYKVKTGGEIQKIDNLKQIIIPSLLIDGLRLSPNQLSEGTFKTLALVFYILNDNSEVLLIEEPEVSVHHGLLNSIVELIKQQSKNKQIVISTHSDYVLDMLQPKNILLVNKSLDFGTKAQLLTKTLSKNDYKVLKDYLQNSGNLGEYWKEGGFENE